MLLYIVLSATVLAPPVPMVVSELTPKEREFAVKLLEETRQKFLASIDGVNDEQWTFKAAPDRWSIAEVAEHIAVSESTILQLVTEKFMKAPAPDPAPAATDRLPDQKVIDAVTDRTGKFQAPEMLKPTNRWPDRAALTRDFLAAREKTLAYVSQTKEDLRAHAAPHPVLKNLDAYQWVLLIAAHSARHTAQIEEVKTASGYPKR